MPDAPLWRPGPDRVLRSHLTAFRQLVSERHGTSLADSRALWQFSVDRSDLFWVASGTTRT